MVSHTTNLYDDKFYIYGNASSGGVGLSILDPTTEEEHAGRITGTHTKVSLEEIPFPSVQLHTATLYEDTLYIFGGSANGTRINTLSSLNLKTLSYQPQVPIKGGTPPGVRSFHSACLVPNIQVHTDDPTTIGPAIVIFGGFFGLESWSASYKGSFAPLL